jgi:hypothetical protein
MHCKLRSTRGWIAPVILEALIFERMGAMPAQRKYPEEPRGHAVKTVLEIQAWQEKVGRGGPGN